MKYHFSPFYYLSLFIINQWQGIEIIWDNNEYIYMILYKYCIDLSIDRKHYIVRFSFFLFLQQNFVSTLVKRYVLSWKFIKKHTNATQFFPFHCFTIINSIWFNFYTFLILYPFFFFIFTVYLSISVQTLLMRTTNNTVND